MTTETSVEIKLEQALAQVLALDATNKDAVVAAGVMLEELAQSLETDHAREAELIHRCLGILQTVYEGAADASAADQVLELLGQCRDAIVQESAPSVQPAVTAGTPAEKPIQAENPANETKTSAAPVAAAPAAAPVAAVQAEKPAAAPAGASAAATPASAATATTPAVLAADTDMDLLKEFIVECLDHIAAAEAALLSLETNAADTELINTIFRAFHTIKGTSGFLGLDRIQRLAHLAENHLDKARSGQIQLVDGNADLALSSCDMLKMMIEGLRGVNPGEPLPVPAELDTLLEHLTNPASVVGTGGPEPMRLGDILVGKGVADRKVVEQVAAEQGAEPLGVALVEKGAASVTAVASALRTQKHADPSADATVRVGTERLDMLINMVGELVIAQSMVAADPYVVNRASGRLSRNVGHAGKIVRELQDLTMSLRMVPMKATFQKMNRLVRDLARKSGKNVQYITEGEGTEIDRNMVEVLNDPLVHMIRNAVDHGLETPEERAAAGKSETGTVTLRAYHSAGNVVLEMIDDGKGLDKEKIVAKAISKGLIESGRELTEAEIFGLIFRPGFSTADKITDVSGRGVGMDVVKKGVESVRGRIEISSAKGKGTTFTIRLPLTMAICDAMLLGVGSETYLLPTATIQHSFRPAAESLSSVVGRGEMVQLRGELLPLFRLHRLFGVSGAVEDAPQALLVIVEGQGRRCALMVDELLGQQQVVIKSLGQSLAGVPGVAGGAILGDGKVGLILDAAGLVQLAQRDQKAVA